MKVQEIWIGDYRACTDTQCIEKSSIQIRHVNVFRKSFLLIVEIPVRFTKFRGTLNSHNDITTANFCRVRKKEKTKMNPW